MIIVREAMRLPMAGFGLLFTVDWFLERFRTAVKVWGEGVGAEVIHRDRPMPPESAMPDAHRVPG